MCYKVTWEISDSYPLFHIAIERKIIQQYDFEIEKQAVSTFTCSFMIF